MAIIGSLIGAGASLLGGMFNWGSQKSTNKSNRQLAEQQNLWNQQAQDRAFAHNREMSDYAYQQNLDMWNRQNEYNSPTAQMGRLSEAGLNPNLMYGSGSVGNSSSQAPQYSPASYDAPRAERSTDVAPRLQFDPYQAVNLYQTIAMRRAQVDNLSSQTEYTHQNTRNAAVDQAIKAAQLLGVQLTNRQREDLYDVTIQQAKETLRKTTGEADSVRQSIQNLISQNNLTQHQIHKVAEEIQNLRLNYDVGRFKERLLRLGISDSDGLIERLAARLFLSSDLDFEGLQDLIPGWR